MLPESIARISSQVFIIFAGIIGLPFVFQKYIPVMRAVGKLVISCGINDTLLQPRTSTVLSNVL